MLNKFDLQREVGSLDLLISAVSSEILLLPDDCAESESPYALIKEMEEALCQLRQARGLRKILLTALEDDFGMDRANKQASGERRRNRRTTHSSTC